MSKSVSRKSTPAKRSTRLSPEAAKLLPYDDFPLSPHLPTRRWYKVIRGFRHYFGPLDDPDAALAKYLRERDYLYTGRTPPPDPEDLYTIRDLCNEFLTAQDRRVNTGDLTARTRVELHRACTNITKALGKDRAVEDLRPEDFEKLRALLAKTKNDQQRSPTVLAKSIRHVKQVFKWAFDNDRIEKPVKYGTYFDPPSEALLREQKNKRDDLIFTATEIKALLSKASVPMKAMILLGINCGYGNTDIAELPHRAVDLDAGIVVFPRPKTKVKRWCP
ncbi:MAG: hypothetical protein ACOC9Q_01465, partial [bacterium]